MERNISGRVSDPDRIASKDQIPFGLEANGLTIEQARDWLRFQKNHIEAGRDAAQAVIRAWEDFRARFKRIDDADVSKGWVSRTEMTTSESRLPTIAQIEKYRSASRRVWHEVDLSGFHRWIGTLPKDRFAESGFEASPGWLDFVIEHSAPKGKRPSEVVSLKFSKGTFHSVDSVERWALGQGFLPSGFTEGVNEFVVLLAPRGDYETISEVDLDSGVSANIGVRSIQEIAAIGLMELPPKLEYGSTSVHEIQNGTGHQHRYVLDPDVGSGITDENGSGGDWYGHSHRIIDGRVFEGGIDLHQHTLIPSGINQDPFEPRVTERIRRVADGVFGRS